MGIFRGRRNERDEDYEEEDERVVRRRSVKQSFDDVKPGRRRKKESPKPWGKKERLLVFITLALTVGMSAVLYLSARSWKLPGLPRIKLPSFSLPDFGERIIIIEGNKDDKRKADDVIVNFKEKTKNLSGVYGLYVVRLENGSSYGVNELEIFEAASFIKLPVMAVMYMQVESGDMDLETKHTLSADDKVGGSGSLIGKPAGYTLTYKDLVRLMGKQSDNTAFNIARNILGDEEVENVIKQIGMANTSLLDNETTPYDIGTFFEELWKDNIVSEESRDEILAFLTDTIYEDHLAAGIPDEIRIAHKYGREVHVVNDAGIIFTDEPFIVVIMSKGVVESEADEVIPELAKMVYEVEVEN
ncbi:class A beta-lactamase-related serine hydrolase [Patescibacteria group bacterium]|nr:class A beta-lactamase-related serine hydrolase [Patescibacteria group bacterium]